MIYPTIFAMKWFVDTVSTSPFSTSSIYLSLDCLILFLYFSKWIILLMLLVVRSSKIAVAFLANIYWYSYAGVKLKALCIVKMGRIYWFKACMSFIFCILFMIFCIRFFHSWWSIIYYLLKNTISFSSKFAVFIYSFYSFDYRFILFFFCCMYLTIVSWLFIEKCNFINKCS
jgi:hypothetical protein